MTAPDPRPLDAALAGERAEWADTAAARDRLAGELASAQTTIGDLRARLGAVQPKPSTLVGACPMTTVADLDARWGRRVDPVRIFHPGKVAALPSDRRVVGSFKTISDDATQAAWQGKAWRWTYLHEVDVKYRKKQVSDGQLEQWRRDLTKLAGLGNYDGASVILSAYTFEKASGDSPDRYAADVPCLGVDFDGVSAKADGKLHDYRPALDAVHAYTQRRGLRWGVAEFGAGIPATADPTGEKRATWMTDLLRLFRDAGAEYVTLWEASTYPDYVLTRPAETAAWRALLT